MLVNNDLIATSVRRISHGEIVSNVGKIEEKFFSQNSTQLITTLIEIFVGSITLLICNICSECKRNRFIIVHFEIAALPGGSSS